MEMNSNMMQPYLSQLNQPGIAQGPLNMMQNRFGQMGQPMLQQWQQRFANSPWANDPRAQAALAQNPMGNVLMQTGQQPSLMALGRR